MTMRHYEIQQSLGGAAALSLVTNGMYNLLLMHEVQEGVLQSWSLQSCRTFSIQPGSTIALFHSL